MGLDSRITKRVMGHLHTKLALKPGEEKSLEFQIDWFKHHIELEAYVSANRLMGVQPEGQQLPLVVLDEDLEIQELTLPHEVDWSEADKRSLKSTFEQLGIKIAVEPPSEDFLAFYNAALPTQLAKIVEQTVKHSRENITDIGLYLPQQPYITHALEDGDTINIVNTVESTAISVETKMSSKPLIHRFFSHNQSVEHGPAQTNENGVSR